MYSLRILLLVQEHWTCLRWGNPVSPVANEQYQYGKKFGSVFAFETTGVFSPLPQWVVGTESSTGDTGTLPACSGSIHPVLDSELGVWTFQSMLTHAFSTITDIALLQQRQLIGLGVPIRPEGSLLPLGIIPTDNRVFRAFAVSTRIVPHQPLTVLGFTADRLVCAQTFNLP